MSQKSKIIAFNTVFFITMLLTLSVTSNVFGAPRDPNFDDPNTQCWTQPDLPGLYSTTCCWDVVEPDDPEQIEIEYCQHCTYDPSTQTHTDCGEVTQPRTSTPDVGRILPDKGNDLPVLEQEPNQSISPQFDDGIKTDVPRVGIMEQTPPSDTGSNDEGKSDQDNNSNDKDSGGEDSSN